MVFVVTHEKLKRWKIFTVGRLSKRRFWGHGGQPEMIWKLNVTSHVIDNQVTVLKIGFLLSVLKLQKREKIGKLYEHWICFFFFKLYLQFSCVIWLDSELSNSIDLKNKFSFVRWQKKIFFFLKNCAAHSKTQVEQEKKRLKLGMCFFRRIQKRSFDPRFCRSHDRKERNTRKRVCNLGNFAYTFEMTASRQLEPFLRVDQAQRLARHRTEEKFRLLKRWYLLQCSKKNGQNERNYNSKTYCNQTK